MLHRLNVKMLLFILNFYNSTSENQAWWGEREQGTLVVFMFFRGRQRMEHLAPSAGLETVPPSTSNPCPSSLGRQHCHFLSYVTAWNLRECGPADLANIRRSQHHWGQCIYHQEAQAVEAASNNNSRDSFRARGATGSVSSAIPWRTSIRISSWPWNRIPHMRQPGKLSPWLLYA